MELDPKILCDEMPSVVYYVEEYRERLDSGPGRWDLIPGTTQRDLGKVRVLACRAREQGRTVRLVKVSRTVQSTEEG